MPRKSISIKHLNKSNKCIKKSSKLNRQGPPYSAKDCKHLGQLGNDKQLYYSLMVSIVGLNGQRLKNKIGLV